MFSMAAESDGICGMVSSADDDQPIDLSRGSKKSTRLMPPLIPISLLPSGYHQRRFPNRESLGAKRNTEPSDRLAATGEESTREVSTRLENGPRDDEWRESQSSPKRTRLNGEDGWEGTFRLDRARSVPQLTPLPSLQRHKSLSESRIPEAAAEAEAKASLGPEGTCEIVRALERNHRLNLLGHNVDLTNILIYLGSYRQLYQNYQARELLRRLALQHRQENSQAGSSSGKKRKSGKRRKIELSHTQKKRKVNDNGRSYSTRDQLIYTSFGDKLPDTSCVEAAPPSCTVTRPTNPPQDDANDLRRRQARPLTGKHVRPGTGAKPSTLLTLRRKIQSRQPQLDQQPQLPK